jgi:hypothetical protein
MPDSWELKIPFDIKKSPPKQKAMRANVLSGGPQAFMALQLVYVVVAGLGVSYPRLIVST